MNHELSRRYVITRALPDAVSLGAAVLGAGPQSPEQAPVPEGGNRDEILKIHRFFSEYVSDPARLAKISNIRTSLAEMGFSHDPINNSPLVNFEIARGVESIHPVLFESRVALGLNTMEDLREKYDYLTGKVKYDTLTSREKTTYISGDTTDGTIAIEQAKMIIEGVLGPATGSIVERVTYSPDHDKEQPAGSVTERLFILRPQVEYHEENEEHQRIRKNVSSVMAESLELFNTYELSQELAATVMYAAEGSYRELQHNIQKLARYKAMVIDLTVRHEVFGHLFDPLENGELLYTFDERLDHLQEVLTYLKDRPKLLEERFTQEQYDKDHPDDVSSSDPDIKEARNRWKRIDVAHKACATIVEDMTDPPAYPRELYRAARLPVSTAQLRLIEHMWARSGIQLTARQIQEVSTNAIQHAQQAFEADLRSSDEYAAVHRAYEEVKKRYEAYIGTQPVETAITTPTAAADREFTPVTRSDVPIATPTEPYALDKLALDVFDPFYKFPSKVFGVFLGGALGIAWRIRRMNKLGKSSKQ